MDAESPQLLERFRDRAAIKAVLLRFEACAEAAEARFNRKDGNDAYWPPILAAAAAIAAAGHPVNARQPIEIYGRPCRLMVVTFKETPTSPHAIAVVAADDGDLDDLAEFIADRCRDYWYGSYFWK